MLVSTEELSQRQSLEQDQILDMTFSASGRARNVSMPADLKPADDLLFKQLRYYLLQSKLCTESEIYCQHDSAPYLTDGVACRARAAHETCAEEEDGRVLGP